MENIWLEQYPEEVPQSIDPDIYLSIIDMVDQACQKYNHKEAITSYGSSLSYCEMMNLSEKFATYLQKELKLKKGDRIGIMLPNLLQYIITMIGALRAGLIVVNINPMYTKRELTHQLVDADVNTIVILKNFCNTLEASLPEVNIKNIIVTGVGDLFSFPKRAIVNFTVSYIKRLIPRYHLPHAVSLNRAIEIGGWLKFEPVPLNGDDIAFLQYTGGTTGVSKGAILTHRNICANSIQSYTWMSPLYKEGQENVLLPLPLYHIYSLQTFFIFMNFGANTTLISDPRKIPELVKVIRKTKFTVIVGLNTLFRGLLLNKEFRNLDFSDLICTTAGAMLTTREVANDWEKVTGNAISQGYGLTEASPIVTFPSFKDHFFDATVGYPIPSTEVKIVDENGSPVSFGAIGELLVKGPQVMRGYWNMPEETAKVLSSDGWLKTGDLATMDEQGKISIVDRVKDMISVSGLKVYPNEVEEVLMSHPGILEAAVVGEQDQAHGEIVKAFVVLKNKKLTKEEIIKYCHENLTHYKVPKIIVFVAELPKSPVGKTLRRLLRAHPTPPDKARKKV